MRCRGEGFIFFIVCEITVLCILWSMSVEVAKRGFIFDSTCETVSTLLGMFPSFQMCIPPRCFKGSKDWDKPQLRRGTICPLPPTMSPMFPTLCLVLTALSTLTNALNIPQYTFNHHETDLPDGLDLLNTSLLELNNLMEVGSLTSVKLVSAYLSQSALPLELIYTALTPEQTISMPTTNKD